MHIATCFFWTFFFLERCTLVTCGVWRLAGFEVPKTFLKKTLPASHHVSNNEALEDEFRLDDLNELHEFCLFN